MANQVQFKRRVSGAAGSPTGLKSGEPAYNMVDHTLYVGHGDDGSGNATSIEALAGKGAFVDRSADQTIGGVKTFSNSPKVPNAVASDEAASKGQVDTGLATRAPLASPAFTGTPTAPTATGGTNTTQVATTAFVQSGLAGKANTGHTHAIGDVTNLQTTLDGKAPLASPAFTGAPTAPTAAGGTSNTQLATTAFVAAAIAALVDTAPGTLDTLKELAAALGNDPNFAATITAQIGEKLAKSANLSDLVDAAAARTNLGLGSMATQAANSVNISGGTIGAGVTVNAAIDGGTF